MIDWSDDRIFRLLGREDDAVLARRLGCSRATVAQRRILLGIPAVRKPGRPRREDRAPIVDAREEARTLFEAEVSDEH